MYRDGKQSCEVEFKKEGLEVFFFFFFFQQCEGLLDEV